MLWIKPSDGSFPQVDFFLKRVISMKLCPACHHENEENELFCSSCGRLMDLLEEAKVREAVSEEEQRHPLSNRQRRALFVLSTLLIAAVLTAVIVLAIPGRFADLAHGALFLENDSRLLVVFDGGEPIVLPDTVRENCQLSPNGDCLLFTDNSGELYTLKRGDIAPQALGSVPSSFGFCADGSLFYYLADNTLYITAPHQAEAPSSSPDVSAVAFSPNGHYRVCADVLSQAWQLIDGAKSVALPLSTAEWQITALSNNGRFLYGHCNETDSFYVLTVKGNDITSKTLLCSGTPSFQFYNTNGTQLMYSDDVNGKTLLSENGRSGQVVLNKAATSLLTPNGCRQSIGDLNGCTVLTEQGAYAVSVSVSYALSPSSDVVLSRNGKQLLSLYSDSLFRTAGLPNSVDDPVELSADITVKKWVCSRSGSSLYFIDANGFLYYVRGSQAPKLIGENVSDVAMSCDDATCLAVCNGDLYSARNGSKLKKISGMSHIKSIQVGVGQVIATAADGVYRSTGGTSFVEITLPENAS